MWRSAARIGTRRPPERGFLDLYLSKIAYLRWAERGAPLYLQFGSIEGVTFGNGFIVDHYANTLFLARRRVFGGEVGLDGELVGVPFLGTQLFVGNLVAFDLIGTRVYVRPFSLGDSLFLQQILIGAAYVFDRMPAEDGRVAGYGIDLRVPLLYTGPVSVAALLDGAQLHGSHHGSNRAKIPTGGAIGLDGKVAWFDWRAQLRYHSYNFIPGYFGPAYDTVRRRNYEALRVQEEKEDEPDRLGHLGWLAQVGIRLDSGAGVSLSLDGPFELSEKPGPASGYAHLRARGFLPAGIVGGLSFDLTYDQTVDPANARSRGWLRALMIAETASVIRARVNYQFGPVVLSYVYSRLRDGDGAPVISSGIESMVTLW